MSRRSQLCAHAEDGAQYPTQQPGRFPDYDTHFRYLLARNKAMPQAISKRATSTVKKPTGKIQAMSIPAPSATAITAMQQFPPRRHMAQPPFPLHPMWRSAPG